MDRGDKSISRRGVMDLLSLPIRACGILLPVLRIWDRPVRCLPYLRLLLKSSRICKSDCYRYTVLLLRRYYSYLPIILCPI